VTLWKSIVALGDSLTSGFQSTQSYGYPSYTPYTNFLQSLLLISGKDVIVLNKGIDGDTTSGMKERFDRSVTPEKPDYVIIWAGINDLYSGVTISEIKSNILDLFKMCNNIPSTPIFCSLTPVIEASLINDKIRKLNTVISK
jgi:lysophospholipase L1-like esterase